MAKNIIDTKILDTSDIRDDINSLKSNTVELARHLKDAGVHRSEEMTKATSVRFKAITAQSKEQLKIIETKIKEKPLQSIAVAFIAGLVFEALLRRR